MTVLSCSGVKVTKRSNYYKKNIKLTGDKAHRTYGDTVEAWEIDSD